MINKLGLSPKIVLAIGSTITLGGITISTFITNFWGFVFFFGVLSGIGCGMNYFVPMVCAWEYFPERKGLMTGILMGAYGLGSLVWVQVSTRIVNPDNEGTYDVGIDNLKYFHADVAMRVPRMFRILVIIWLCEVLLSLFLISRPNKKELAERVM